MAVYKDNPRKGTWKVKMSYLSWDGKRKFLTKRGFKSKGDANKWELNFRSKLVGTLDMELKNFVEIYLEGIEEKTKRSTMETKRNIIYKWIVPYLGHKPLNSITNRDIIKWQNMLLKHTNNSNERYKSSYLKTIHNQLNAILNYARRFYNLPNNPASAVGNMGTDKDIEIDFWTKDEYLKFKDFVSERPEYYYCFEVLYWCGIREGELLALTVGDIDFDNKELIINKTYNLINGQPNITPPKTRKSNRRVKMPEFLVEELKDYLSLIYMPRIGDRLFPVTKTNLTKIFKQYSYLAGVKEIRIHDLRHSHVSLLISMGFSATLIAERMGHESIYITYHYAHLFPNAQASITTALDGLLEDE